MAGADVGWGAQTVNGGKQRLGVHSGWLGVRLRSRGGASGGGGARETDITAQSDFQKLYVVCPGRPDDTFIYVNMSIKTLHV